MSKPSSLQPFRSGCVRLRSLPGTNGRGATLCLGCEHIWTARHRKQEQPAEPSSDHDREREVSSAATDMLTPIIHLGCVCVFRLGSETTAETMHFHSDRCVCSPATALFPSDSTATRALRKIRSSFILDDKNHLNASKNSTFEFAFPPLDGLISYMNSLLASRIALKAQLL